MSEGNEIDKKCQLLGGVFSLLVQVCLGFMCIGTLIIKRQNEVPQRDWFVWFLDVMKQGVGSSFGHFSNIFLSVIIAQSLTKGDECQWYCLTYVIDSTFGTLLNLVFLSCFEKIIHHYQFATEYLNFGEYGDPPNLNIFALQLCIWLTIVIFGKTIILFALLQLIVPIDEAMSVVFRVFKNHPDVELVIVMIVIPGILNTLQFWVTDTFLKKQATHAELLGSAHSLHSPSGSPRGLGGKHLKHSNGSHSMLSGVDSDLDEELINTEEPTSPLPHWTSQDSFLRSNYSSQHRTIRRDKGMSPEPLQTQQQQRGRSNSAPRSVLDNLLQSNTLSASTKLHVVPPVSYFARMYKQSGMTWVWAQAFGGRPGSSSSRSGSKRSPPDDEEEDDDDVFVSSAPSSCNASYRPIGEGSAHTFSVGVGGARSPLRSSYGELQQLPRSSVDKAKTRNLGLESDDAYL